MSENIDGTGQKEHEDVPEVTIKCGKGLVSEPFTAKSGKEMVRINIPNQDPADKRSWESFVLPSSMVHDNQYGKGVWMKLPENGTTTLSRSVVLNEKDDGTKVWGSETRKVPNTDLKEMVEAYKSKDHDLDPAGSDDRPPWDEIPSGADTKDSRGKDDNGRDEKKSVLSDLGDRKTEASETAKNTPKKEHTKSKSQDVSI